MQGGDAGVDDGLQRPLPEFVFGDFLHLRSGDNGLVAGGEAYFPGNGRRGVRMVTGDHDHANAGGATLGHGVLGLLARRVIHAGQTDKHQVTLDRLGGEFGGWGVVQVAIGRSEHPQGLLCHCGVLRLNTPAILVRHGPDSGTGGDLRAELQQHIGRTVDQGAEPAIPHPANHRVPFAVGVERNGMVLGQIRLDLLAVAAGLSPGRKQGPFGGVADSVPIAVFFNEMRIVAAEENGCQFEQRGGVFGPRFFARQEDVPVRSVAVPGHLIASASDIEPAHGHFAGRERSGFIRADDGRRTERLDSRQSAYERVPAGHAQHAERERDRDDGRQPFRDSGHRKADRGHCQFIEIGPAQHPQPEQQGDNGQRRPDKDAADRIEFLLQRGALFRALFCQQSGDAAQFGVHCRGHHDGQTGPRGDPGRHKDHVGAVAQGDIASGQGRGLFRHRCRFAGQRRFNAPQ